MKPVSANEVDDVEGIFNNLATGAWIEDGCESVSGPGSSLSYTEHFRSSLERFLAAIACRSLLDAPCGDFNWMRTTKVPDGMRYFGADIVNKIIEFNSIQYGSSERYFMKMNLITDPLPDADVWLCRDCLFHLSLEHALAVIKNGVRSNFRYYMITSHFNEKNIDIVTGGFRELNLEKPPFCFPKPIASVLDFVDHWPARQVGVWTRDQVLGTLISDHSAR